MKDLLIFFICLKQNHISHIIKMNSFFSVKNRIELFIYGIGRNKYKKNNHHQKYKGYC